MKSLKDTYELYNGVNIPCIGFGTWQTPDGEVAVSSVKEAIAAGYRHIDTAAGYNNEESVGLAVKESYVPREELFITSKLHNNDHGYEATLAAFELTMKKLELDYLDLYLIHWPNPIKFRDTWKEANAGSWKAFEELYKAGKIRAIGVSNFMPHHMDALLETAKIKPMVNQIRLCPGETQEAAVSYCKSNQIQLEAYSPLGTGRVFEVKEMQELSKKYNKSIAQICVRWSLQMGYLPLPKSVTPERIRENGDVFDFEISLDDVALIAGLTECCGPTRDPDTTNF
ncbi:dehydrogenase [Anaerocolumna cellulosilytica]|uniref:Dehydrogenase n=1 Tax=Anaerocolumna cellulosilytica TaxID=433286 RepID=A0A6S6QXT7_9FIRM|nr:aldo/keto reductase [Anaerocolumna cellulosilytica]MBB5195490.1 diketogulonate reductase-like aldo/keto reductase [Anaerocolumna cellulosilytica]BCJ96023.1 dehydrogenase [Anaerocolumna cellulosilytica]